ncbi:BPSL0067 family protein [Paraburkholderia rhizosphaerae]|uniref:NlpC/P60 family protein n=1 Tax=Paraburkholderia rhizosphaerae TaxID=480658 RepID=A0A4R8LBI8_9BURK|nr:BPSL0067 family protein [Paraburkholderia rhizosphaerae]TDY40263.1 hypothetical protein BX592_12616 [Paraburkholderia rhizosphaerae]
MPHVLQGARFYSGRSYLNGNGNAECVEFIQQTLDAPRTIRWREGDKVIRIPQGNADLIPTGSAIATFVDGQYPQHGSTGMHAAIYLGQSEDGIEVVDQWRGQGKVLIRTIPWKPRHSGLSNDGSEFPVIEW